VYIKPLSGFAAAEGVPLGLGGEVTALKAAAVQLRHDTYVSPQPARSFLLRGKNKSAPGLGYQRAIL